MWTGKDSLAERELAATAERDNNWGALQQTEPKTLLKNVYLCSSLYRKKVYEFIFCSKTLVLKHKMEK